MGAVDEQVVEQNEFSGFGAFATDFDEGAFLFKFPGGGDEDLEGGRGEGGEEGRRRLLRPERPEKGEAGS